MTPFGRRLHLVGVNSKAAAFSGINYVRFITAAYINSGLLAAIAGLISLSRVALVKADFGGCDSDGGSGEIPA